MRADRNALRTTMRARACIAATIRADVRALARYPVAYAEGWIKLDAMENPYALPADVVRGRARRRHSPRVPINRYPDGRRARACKRRVARKPAAARRSDSAHARQRLRRADPDPDGARSRPAGAVVLAPEPSFVMYRRNALAAQARFVGVPLHGDFRSTSTRCWRRSSASGRRSCGSRIRTIRPATCSTSADVERIIRAAPGLVAIDEAYYAFADASFLPRVLEFPNVVVVRTVSKIGMAGLRLGYAVGHPDWIDELDKIRPPYNVNSLTQAALPVLLAHADAFARAGGGDPRASARRVERALAALPRRPHVRDADEFRAGARARCRRVVCGASRREDPGQEPRRLASAARELPAHHRRNARGERRAASTRSQQAYA